MKIIIEVEVPDDTYNDIQRMDMHGEDIHDELMRAIEDNLLEWVNTAYLPKFGPSTPPGELWKEIVDFLEWLQRCDDKGFMNATHIKIQLHNQLKRLVSKTRVYEQEKMKRG